MLLVFTVGLANAQEICDNGWDDDGNGLVDLNDPACPCATVIVEDGAVNAIQNHSFEERTCCPQSFVSAISPPWLSCATGWQQATLATSDYLHSCGYTSSGMPLPSPAGEGVVGLQYDQAEGYMEYVGSCLTCSGSNTPLQAGITYTLSLYIASVVTNGQLSQSVAEASALYLFPEAFPLALFARSDPADPFPVATSGCIGQEPGWSELGRVMVVPEREWIRVSITFTPTEPVHSIAIGGACDLPASFARRSATIVPGSPGVFFPYILLDDLLLTVSSAQLLAPVTRAGSLCEGDALVIGSPPMGSSAFQWYHNGIALPGENDAILDVVQYGVGEGWYTLTSLSNGQCLMGSTNVAPGAPMWAALSFSPTMGCSPLEVEFVDQSVGSVSATWILGNGATSTDSAFVHSYQDPGTYDLRLTVSDQNGCLGDTLIANALTVLAGVEAFFSIEPNTVFVGATEVELNGSPSTGEITQWSWILGEALPPTSETAVVQATFPSIPGLYPLLLVVSSADGCMDTVQSVVRVVAESTIEMPNVFSPNGDGSNDRFIPMVYDGSPASLEIYDRWGQRIFSTRVLAKGWSGSGASDGTYFYEVIPDDPIQKRLTGFVTLLR